MRQRALFIRKPRKTRSDKGVKRGHSPGNKTPEDIVIQIRALKAEGKSSRAIARELGMSDSTVRWLLRPDRPAPRERICARERYTPRPPEPWPLPKPRFELEPPARSYAMAPARAS